MICLHCTLPRAALERLVTRLVRDGFGGIEERDVGRRGFVGVVLYAENEAQAAELEQRVRTHLRGSEFADRLEFAVAEFDVDWRSAVLAGVREVALTPNISVVPLRDGASAAADPRVLYLEPALAFGYGDHATTKMAAVWIEEFCRERPGLEMLDVGAGTGILSLIALRAGCARTVGIEIDPIAVRNAKANAALNGLAGRATFLPSFPDPRRGFDLVVVNIELPGLLATAPSAAAAVARKGTLLVTGLLEDQVADVISCYADLGLRLRLEHTRGSWCLLTGAPA